MPVSAVYQKDEDTRFCDLHSQDAEGHGVSFADGFPYLVVAEATLKKLNDTLETPVPMARFRPNIVVGNTAPEEEYTWRTFGTRQARLQVISPCTRCVITTIDQETGVRRGSDPLKTLARTSLVSEDFAGFRIHGAIFGENAIATRCGEISVGDRIEVLATKRGYRFREGKPRLSR